MTVDGAGRATVDDQTIVVPLGGSCRGRETRSGFAQRRLRAGTAVGLAVRPGNGIADVYRWLPWVSRGSRSIDRTTATRSRRRRARSVRVTVVAIGAGAGHDGDRVSVSADGLTQVFEAHDVRDFTVTAHGLPDDRAPGGRTTVAPGTARAPTARPSSTPRSTRSRRSRPGSAVRTVQGRPVGGWIGMESSEPVWIRMPANLRYQVAHETAHSGSTGSSGTTRRGSRSRRGAADFVARFVMGLHRASRCPTARLDLSIYDYSERCYFETIYIQGGNLLDTAAAGWARPRSGPRFGGTWRTAAGCRRPEHCSTRSTTRRR